ncbi:MAG: branched-chain amino acid ABC transporter substrate-binding protein [Bifidobacteriaceae bacterium]|jgi:branched-chain amino acid transport system substrate-binding protein|nr:branched-chain amino acid ABC transporter substrate-binding protein [Bifidobacteriaceae bacterium]
MKRALSLTLAMALLALSGCGSRDQEQAGSDGATAEEKVVKIGVVAPLSGDLSSFGVGIRNSVQLAAQQANDSGALPGWRIEVVDEDDQGSPDVGKNAATKLAGDPEVIGVIGPMNSSVVQQAQPVFDAAGIVQLAPSATNPSLTKGADLSTPSRSYETFFRLCPTDDWLGPFAAKYLLEQGIKKVATVHDKQVYGQGIAEAFTEYFTANGGEITAAETVNLEDDDYNAVITKVKATSPQALYYGGQSPVAGPLAKQMRAAGLSIPLVSGDGIFDESYIELAGESSEGDMATSVGAPVEELDSAKAFVEAYAAAGFKDGYSAYGAYSYDAANLIIEALKTALADAADVQSARLAVVEAIGKTTSSGATGAITFDEFGDNTARVLTVYKVENGKWVPELSADA